VAVIGKAKLTAKAERISNVTALDDYAHVGMWSRGLSSPQCRVISNESCGSRGIGGLTLWDVTDAVAIDNEEAPNDLDFFDITDPRNPVLIAETGIGDWPAVNVNAFGNVSIADDFDVQFI
jgi:hypothetical protein